MIPVDKINNTSSLSYWSVFRLFFVFFSLYLLNDVFYRWDGFMYHSTFYEFLPSVSLVTIFWTFTAAFIALMTWLLLIGIRWFFMRIGRKIDTQILLMFIGFMLLSATVALFGKKLMFKGHLLPAIKFTVLLFTTISAIFLTSLFRNKTNKIHDLLTPLFWLFSFWFVISIPVVTYHTWLKPANNPVLQRTNESSMSNNYPNIVLVIFDAMTARDMQVYGYHRKTTPFINEWAKTASLFTRAESSSNWTTPSMACMMTGKRVWTHKTFQEYSIPLNSDTESLPRVLKSHGYNNIAFVVNPYAAPEKLNIADSFNISPHFLDLVKSRYLVGWKFGIIDSMLTRTFNSKIKFYSWIITPDFILGRLIRSIYFRFTSISQTEAPPEIAFKNFIETINTGVQEPFFAWIHLYPPHDPYLPPALYSGTFDSSTTLRTYNQQRSELSAEKISNPENWEIFRARYDEFIKYADKTFEDFMDDLAKLDNLKNTIIIFTSDHGESFEHGSFTHGLVDLYEQVTHVPFIIKEPHQTKGVIINELVEQIDISPTILDLANIKVPSWMEGRSLKPLLRGENLPQRPIFAMNFKKNPGRSHQITRGTVAVWDGNYKLVHYLDDSKSLLFNLKEDPEELINLFDTQKEIGQKLLTMIMEHLERINGNK